MIAYRTHIAYPAKCKTDGILTPIKSVQKRKRQIISAEVRAAIIACIELERPCQTADRFKVSRNTVIGINWRARRKARKAVHDHQPAKP